jgi:hypothetical protein
MTAGEKRKSIISIGSWDSTIGIVAVYGLDG